MDLSYLNKYIDCYPLIKLIVKSLFINKERTKCVKKNVVIFLIYFMISLFKTCIIYIFVYQKLLIPTFNAIFYYRIAFLNLQNKHKGYFVQKKRFSNTNPTSWKLGKFNKYMFKARHSPIPDTQHEYWTLNYVFLISPNKPNLSLKYTYSYISK